MQKHDSQHPNETVGTAETRDPKQIPEVVGDQASGPAEGDVMNIIADVERHLQRIRNVQQTQEQELLSLAQRSEALSETEAELQQQAEQLRQQQASLEEQSRELESQRQMLEEQQAALREQQESWSARQAEAEATITSRQRKIEEAAHELKARVAEFNEERQSVHEASARLEQDRAKLEKQNAAVQKERDELQAKSDAIQGERDELRNQNAAMLKEHEELQQRVEQAERNVGELISKLESSEKAIEERDQSVSQQAERIAALEQQLQKRSRELNEKSKELNARQSELESLKKQSESSGAELTAAQKKLAELQEEREQGAARAKELDQKLEASQQRIKELSTEVESIGSELKQRDAQLGETKKKLKLAGEKLQSLADALEQQGPMLEKGAAAMAQVHQQKKEIDLLTREVANLRAASDTSEIERRDQRIAELTAALREARGQVPGGGGDAGRNLEKIELLTSELEQARAELNSANVRIEQLTQAAKESGGGEEAARLALAERDARINKLSATIESLEQKLEASGVDGGNNANEQQLAALRTRVSDLEQELEAARSADSRSIGGGPSADLIREKARRLNAVAEHVKRRRDRLRRMRQLIGLQARAAGAKGASSSPGGAMASPNVQPRDYEAEMRERHALEKQRAEIEAVREALTASEQQMVRRWARPRAVVTLLWLLVLVAVNMGGCWLLANHYFPPLRTASVELRPQTRSGEPMAAADAQRWQQWHVETLANENFRRTLARRMGERRLDDFSRPASLGRYLDENLTILSGDRGEFTLTLAGRETGILAPTLDVIASTLAAESSQQMGVRGDNAWAVIESERTDSAGNLRYASLNQWLLEDQRVMYGGIFFAVTLTLSILLIRLIYTRLVRAKRIFDDDNVLIATGPVFDEV